MAAPVSYGEPRDDELDRAALMRVAARTLLTAPAIHAPRRPRGRATERSGALLLSPAGVSGSRTVAACALREAQHSRRCSAAGTVAALIRTAPRCERSRRPNGSRDGR